MSEIEKSEDWTFWKNFIKKHRNSFIIAIIAGICCIIGLILILLWVIEANPFVDPRTGRLGNWTLNYVVGTIILLIIWDLLFVGLPAALFFGIGGYLWWHKLPEEDKQEIKDRDKKEKSRKAQKYGGGGGGFGIFMFIAYCIYIAVDGNYNTPLMDKPYTYWLYSYMLTFMWILIVFGIPAAIILIIVYFKVWRKK